ncbi:hypothetical protein [Roseisolibacter sp. H3M3-2]|uniref:hypothetical protein n=1 Tax=Roseisolibacter sp. H3M3-2 TaxID=3031323 RepID=UPI0023DBF87B|nr:hypothetical protein [Roseisolibacter sp. H3M3-2]MDF1504286.1 hypothetical protein [Roseisolibacter sp. H3M3-2]
MSSPPDASALARALEALGVACEVRVEGALALLVPTGSAAFPDPVTRRRIVEAARDAGFASVSLELPDGPDPAAG